MANMISNVNREGYDSLGLVHHIRRKAVGTCSSLGFPIEKHSLIQFAIFRCNMKLKVVSIEPDFSEKMISDEKDKAFYESMEGESEVELVNLVYYLAKMDLNIPCEGQDEFKTKIENQLRLVCYHLFKDQESDVIYAY